MNTDETIYPDVEYPIRLDAKGFKEVEDIYRRIHHLQGEDPWIPLTYKEPPAEKMVQYQARIGHALYSGKGWCGAHGWCGERFDGVQYYITDRVEYWRPIIQ